MHSQTKNSSGPSPTYGIMKKGVSPPWSTIPLLLFNLAFPPICSLPWSPHSPLLLTHYGCKRELSMHTPPLPMIRNYRLHIKPKALEDYICRRGLVYTSLWNMRCIKRVASTLITLKILQMHIVQFIENIKEEGPFWFGLDILSLLWGE